MIFRNQECSQLKVGHQLSGPMLFNCEGCCSEACFRAGVQFVHQTGLCQHTVRSSGGKKGGPRQDRMLWKHGWQGMDMHWSWSLQRWPGLLPRPSLCLCSSETLQYTSNADHHQGMGESSMDKVLILACRPHSLLNDSSRLSCPSDGGTFWVKNY